MEKTKVLKLYKQTGTTVDTPFPDADSVITSFKYSAKRMGNAPTISATFLYERCLDDEWSDSIYTEFNREKYRLRNTPSSSFDNTSCLYKHNLEFVSERIVLESVYFFDVVTKDGAEDDLSSNSSDFMFAGGLTEFANRFNFSAKWSGIDYEVVVDEGIAKENKTIKFQDQFLYNALKTMYDTFDVPFYFIGTEIHIGYAENIIPDIIRYGADDALISVNRNNTGEQIINRITGIGSDRNITYYYPNPTPKGWLKLEGTASSKYKIADQLAFASKIELDSPIVYKQSEGEFDESTYTDSEYAQISDIEQIEDYAFYFQGEDVVYKLEFTCHNAANGSPGFVPILLTFGDYNTICDWSDYFINGEVKNTKGEVISAITPDYMETNYLGYTNPPGYINNLSHTIVFRAPGKNKPVYIRIFQVNDTHARLSFNSYTLSKVVASFFKTDVTVIVEDGGEEGKSGKGHVYSGLSMLINGKAVKDPFSLFKGGELYDGENNIISYPCIKPYVNNKSIYFGKLAPGKYRLKSKFALPTEASLTNVAIDYSTITTAFWEVKTKGTDVNLVEAGLVLSKDDLPEIGDTLIQKIDKRIDVKNNLMPSIYRGTDGKERFYNAENGAYADENNTFIDFPNLYSETRPREHILRNDEIYPTISGIRNAEGEYIDQILAVATDKFDNDEIYPEGDPNAGKYKHPYFFVKLRKFDGEHGFNLFDHAIENNPMTISMITGDCGACEFTIGVNDNNENTVQVDEDGNIMYDEDSGNVLLGNPLPRQNDTVDNAVWIALKKDINTYGVVMPNITNKLSVKENDRFVILNIDLPEAYVLAAEKRLEDAVIKHMAEHNSEKYSYSVKFSRVYFEENNEVAPLINENAKIKLEYNGNTEWLYVTSFSYNMSDSSPLPEITIELEETVTVKRGVIQQLREQSNAVLKPQLIAITKSLSSNELTIKTLQATISNTNQSNQLLIEDIQNRLLVIEENTGTTDLTELKFQVNNNTNRLQLLRNKLNEHSTQLLTLNTNYETLKSSVQEQGALLLAIDMNVGKIDTDLTELESRVTNVERRVTIAVVTPNENSNN